MRGSIPIKSVFDAGGEPDLVTALAYGNTLHRRRRGLALATKHVNELEHR
jgi:hypothetical protein